MHPSKPKHNPGVVSAHAATAIKNFNSQLVYVQGFRSVINGTGTTPVTINLSSSGQELKGIALIPVTGTNADLANLQVTYVVNNNNILLNVGAPNLNPNFFQGAYYFPTPQPLIGNDMITLNVTNNSGSQVTILANVFYVPRM